MSEPSLPRKTPCASCPYRKDVPSGVWHEEEYLKLELYDGETYEQQSIATFYCHQGNGCVCSGWLAHRDPNELLAVRVGLARGHLDPSVMDYTSTVPLFETGAAAAAHGIADIDAPSWKAIETTRKVAKVQQIAVSETHTNHGKEG